MSSRRQQLSKPMPQRLRLVRGGSNEDSAGQQSSKVKCGRLMCKENEVCDVVNKKCISDPNMVKKIKYFEELAKGLPNRTAKPKQTKADKNKEKEQAEQARAKKEKEQAEEEERVAREKSRQARVKREKEEEEQKAAKEKSRQARVKREQEEEEQKAAKEKSRQARVKREKEEEEQKAAKEKSRQARVKREKEEEEQKAAREKSRQARIKREKEEEEQKVAKRREENEREAMQLKEMRKQALIKQQLKDEQTRKENEQRLAQLAREKAEQKKKEEQRLAQLAREKAQQREEEEQRLNVWRQTELRRLEEEEKAAHAQRQKEAAAKALQAKYDMRDKHPLIWRPYVGKLKQGDPGLQQELSANLRLNDLTAEKVRLACSKTREQFAFQRVLDCLVRPGSPVVRALVQFPAGTGKTRCAVNVFNNYFYDLRPKIFFVPKPALVSNFYRELFKSDNKYREYVLTYFAGKNWSGGTRTYYQHRSKSNNDKWQWTCSSCSLVNEDSPVCIRCNAVEPQAFNDAVDRLEMKGSIGRGPDEKAFLNGGLPAPIRAVAYRNGGSASAIKNLTVLNFADKVRAKTAGKNSSASRPKSPYSDCIVVCDEIHELFDTHGDTGDVKNLEALQTHLRNALNAVLVVMTATPVSSIATMERESKTLMALVKGNSSAGASNEGYVFSFSAFHPALFPKIVPDLNTCNCLATTVKVPVQGANLKYLLNTMLEKGKPGATPKQAKNLKHKLRNACNQANTSAFVAKGAWPKQLAADAANQATKLARIVQDIASRPNEKTLVMVHRSEGMRSLLVTLRAMFKEAGVQWASFKGTADDEVVVSGQLTSSTLLGGGSKEEEDAVPTRRRRLEKDSKNNKQVPGAAKVVAKRRSSAYETNLQDFNSFNPTVHPYGTESGKNKIRVLVVDAQTFTSGVSFFGVQRLVLVNPPQSYMDYKQQIGRPLRACESHMNLPEYMRMLHIDMYVAVLPDLETCVQALGKSKKLVALLRSQVQSRSAALTTPDEDSAQALNSEKDRVVDFLKKNFEDLAIDKGVYSFNKQKTSSRSSSSNKVAANLQQQQQQQQDGFWATVDFVKKWVKEKAVNLAGNLAGKAAKLARSAVAK
jgi:hypothetical protein